ncbi:MAG: hypothetical protein JSV79_02765 [Armatimonadota bacterium]|nr:MAG: hypothetical protein JSV79_02765 [Armatimonadota bacterium]
MCAYLGRRRIIHPTRGRVPFDLYPYQRRLAESRAAQRIVVKARQVGVSQLIAGEALFLAKHLDGVTVLFVSRNLPAAQHLQRMVYRLMESDRNLPPVVRRNEAELAFGNNSVIRSLPATEDTGRTFAATAVYLDEFAHMPWADRIYQAVAPCAARGGRLTVISTPYGKANAFYRLWQKSGLGTRAFARLRVHWSECPEYNPEGHSLDDPNERRRVGEKGAWWQAQRPRFTDDQWAQEYECDFVGSAALVYREFDPELHVGRFEYNPDWPTYVGQDFGYVNPSVALVIQVSPSEDVFVIGEDYHTNRAVSDLARSVYLPVCQKYRVQAWHCDPSGRSEMAELRAAGIPAVGRRSTIEEGVLAVRKLLRPPGGGRPRLHIDRRCVRLIAEMSTYAYREGFDQVEKDQSDHGPDALRYFVVNHWRGAAETEPLVLP